MDATVLIRIGQGLIPGIDDGAVMLHPFKKVIDDIIRALGDLVRHDRSILGIPQTRPMQNKPSDLYPLVGIPRATDTSGAREYLTRHQKRHQRPEPAT